MRRRAGLGDLGLAFCAGFALLLVAASGLATVGYVVGVVGFVVLSVLATALAVRNARVALRRNWSLRLPQLSREHGVAALILAPVVLYAGALLTVARVDLLDEYDAWSMWTMKAKALVVYGNLDTANGIGAAHLDYPLLVPMMQSLIFRFIGSFDTQLLHVEYAILLFAFAAASWRLVHRELRSVAAAGWVLYLFMLPGLGRNVPDALADVPVAIFAALAALASALWLGRRDRGALVFAGLFGAAALWTKNEGAAAIAITGAVCLVLSVGRPLRHRLVPPALAFAFALASFVPWLAWKRANSVGGDTDLSEGFDLGFVLGRRDRSLDAAANFWGQLADGDRWLGLPYFLLVIGVAVLVVRRHTRVAAFALLVPLALLAFYVWVYTVHDDPLGLEWLLATSSSRVITSVALIGATMVLVLLASLSDRRAVSTAPMVAEIPESGRTLSEGEAAVAMQERNADDEEPGIQDSA